VTQRGGAQAPRVAGRSSKRSVQPCPVGHVLPASVAGAQNRRHTPPGALSTHAALASRMHAKPGAHDSDRQHATPSPPGVPRTVPHEVVPDDDTTSQRGRSAGQPLPEVAKGSQTPVSTQYRASVPSTAPTHSAPSRPAARTKRTKSGCGAIGRDFSSG
jgi:hypothetical protein